jgi:uncharacterized protein
MANIKTLLGELMKVEGINSAVVVGRDGFVIDGLTTGNTIDNDALGAMITTGIGSAEVMGSELKVGELTQGMIEYRNGIIVMTHLGAQAVLAVVADLKANLGNVRYQVKKRQPDLEKAL